MSGCNASGDVARRDHNRITVCLEGNPEAAVPLAPSKGGRRDDDAYSREFGPGKRRGTEVYLVIHRAHNWVEGEGWFYHNDETVFDSIEDALELCWKHFANSNDTEQPFALVGLNTETGMTRHVYNAKQIEEEAYSLWKQSEDYERYQEEQEIDRQIDEYREFARGGVL